MIRLSIVFIATLFFAVNCANSQVPGSINGKASLPALVQDGRQKVTDFIVVYDDNAIQKEAVVLQSQLGIPSHHSRIIEHKATRYAEKKQEVLSNFVSQEVTVLKDYSHLPVSFVRIHSKAAINRLLAHPGVVGVYEDRVERLHLAESLPLIGQPQVAAQGDQGAGTAVAVLDTGVDYTQPAFGSCTAPGANCKVVYAQDFNPGVVADSPTHGTNVAGIVAGVAPGTTIIDLKVFGGSSNNGHLIIDAINWAIANKTTYKIVAMNLSLGSGKYTTAVIGGFYNAAVDNARAAGILTIAAAGNDGFTNALALPAATSGAVSVGAVYDSTMGAMNWGAPSNCQDPNTSADKVTCFSNSASFLTLLAPGSVITAAGISESGTSQATPHVSGAAAVLRAAFPNETLDQTIARLANGVTVSDSRNDIVKPRLYLPTALGLSTQCFYAISQPNASYSSSHASGSVSVATSIGCPWIAASNTNWITVTVGSSGSGNGTLSYSILANPNSFSRTGTLSIAGQTYTVTQSGSTGTAANILANPGFESGPISWTSQTANGLPVINTYLSPTTNNSWYAWFCGYDSCADTLYQDVTIPASIQNAYVQFNYWIKTAETSTVTAYDSGELRIYSPPNSSTYTTLSTFSNLNATTGWVLSQKYDVSAFRGQTIRLQFFATTDSSLATNFYLDDVVLNVSGATADTQAPTLSSGLTATAISTSAINLVWSAATDNVGVTSYKIYRDGVFLVTLGNVLAYDDTRLATATSHSYTMSACDAAGNCSAQSATVLATTDANYYQASSVAFVGTSTEQVNGSSVNIIFSKIQNQSSTYTSGSLRIELWAMNAPYAYTGTVRGYKTASIRTNLITGGSDQLIPNGSFSGVSLNLPYTAPPSVGYLHYVLFLEEFQTNCTTADHFCAIDYINYHPFDTQPPTMPTGLTATAISSTNISLTWTASSDNVGVTSYKIYRSGTLVATLGNVTSALRTNTPSTTYSYTVSACDAAGNCSEQSVAVSVTTPAAPTISLGTATIYNIPSPTNVDQAFLRIYNTSSTNGAVRGTLYDQTGAVLGTPNSVLIPSALAKSVTVLASQDIANAVGVPDWTGRAWISVQSDFSELQILNLVRSSLLISMSCLNSQYALYLPNPSSSEQPYLRLYNPSSTAGAIRGTLYDESGTVLGTSNAVLVSSLAANSVQVLASTDIAKAFGVASWTGRAWMSLTSDFTGLKIMNTLRDQNTNTLVNVSCDTGSTGTSANVYNIPPTSLVTTAASVRIYNMSSSASAVTGTVYAETGSVLGTANASLGNIPANGVLTLSQSDIASKVGANTWTGRAWMQVNSSATGLKVLAFTKLTTNMDMNCVNTSNVVFNIPDATNAQDQPNIRIYNTSATTGNVFGTLYDVSGNLVGTANSLLVSNMPAKSVASLTASTIASAVGSLGWTSRAWMQLTSTLSGLQVMNILQDSVSGTWSNMSCATN